MIASTDDVLWVDLKNDDEVDIDEAYSLSAIKSILFVDGKFYVLANRFQMKLGYFLLELPGERPRNNSTPKYLIKWKNKLEISDAALHLLNIKRGDNQKEMRELVVSYKSMYVNLYTVFVIEIDTGHIKFKHENSQLWESPVKGFLNSNTHDFIILNKEGTSFIPLGNVEKKSILNPDGVKRMVHSLGSCDYLKIGDSNHVKFSKPKMGETDRFV